MGFEDRRVLLAESGGDGPSRLRSVLAGAFFFRTLGPSFSISASARFRAQ